jgi:hypothetical protein
VKKIAALVLLVCGVAFSQEIAAPGFTFTVQPMTWGRHSGVIILYRSDNPNTIAFIAEVNYQPVGTIAREHVIAYCMKRFGGDGAVFVPIGSYNHISVSAWEVTGLGRHICAGSDLGLDPALNSEGGS